ncbi:MAG TPA: hypothetical protein VHH73_04295 [Verrucomicrobiae bacterium]|nr:hypothetical protein [Verrucomicrobiae bacterium]
MKIKVNPAKRTSRRLEITEDMAGPQVHALDTNGDPVTRWQGTTIALNQSRSSRAIQARVMATWGRASSAGKIKPCPVLERPGDSSSLYPLTGNEFNQSWPCEQKIKSSSIKPNQGCCSALGPGNDHEVR